MGPRFYFNSDLSTSLIVLAQFVYFVLNETVLRRRADDVGKNAIADINDNGADDDDVKCLQCDADDEARRLIADRAVAETSDQRTVLAPKYMRCDSLPHCLPIDISRV